MHLRTTALVGTVLAASIISLSANAASITNGDFEAVPIGAPFNSSNSVDIPGWTHTGPVGDALLWAIGYHDGGGGVTVAGSGNQFVTLGGGFLTSSGAASTWATTITGLTAGNSYDLNFKIAFEGGDTPVPQQSMTVGFASGSSTASQVFSAPFNPGNYWKIWLPETLVFTATATSAIVDFSVVNQINDMGLDSVGVSNAPVPGPVAGAGLPGLMFAGGSLGFLWRRRRTCQ